MSLHVITSVGVALCKIKNEVPADLLERADTALYRAKKAGRNNDKIG